jgi:hypothetical protein
MEEGIFGPSFVPDEFREAVSGRAWLRAMLDAEAALATAEARVGLIPHEAAATIASCCEASRFDPEQLGREARAEVPGQNPEVANHSDQSSFRALSVANGHVFSEFKLNGTCGAGGA